MEYCETFGHDLETGAPITEDQYRALNPAGRRLRTTSLSEKRQMMSILETVYGSVGVPLSYQSEDW